MHAFVCRVETRKYDVCSISCSCFLVDVFRKRRLIIKLVCEISSRFIVLFHFTVLLQCLIIIAISCVGLERKLFASVYHLQILSVNSLLRS